MSYVRKRRKETDLIQKMLINAHFFEVEKENQKEINSLAVFFELLEEMIYKYFGKENLSLDGWDFCSNGSADWEKNAFLFVKQINKKTERILNIKINDKVKYKIVFFSFDDDTQIYVCNILRNKKKIHYEKDISNLLYNSSNKKKNVEKIREFIIDNLKRNNYKDLLLSNTNRKLIDLIINRKYEKKIKRKFVNSLIHSDNIFRIINKHRFPFKNEYINWYESILEKSFSDELKLKVATHCLKQYSFFYFKKKIISDKPFHLYNKKYMVLMDKCCSYLNEKPSKLKLIKNKEKKAFDLIQNRKETLIKETQSVIDILNKNEPITSDFFINTIFDLFYIWLEDLFDEQSKKVFNEFITALTNRLRPEMDTPDFNFFIKENKERVEELRDLNTKSDLEKITDMICLFYDYYNEY